MRRSKPERTDQPGPGPGTRTTAEDYSPTKLAVLALASDALANGSAADHCLPRPMVVDSPVFAAGGLIVIIVTSDVRWLRGQGSGGCLKIDAL